MLTRILLLSLLCKSAFASNSTIVSKVGAVRHGAYKYLYDESVLDACDTVLFLAVGSAMGVKDYDSISTAIVSDSSVVTIVSDHNPRFPVKLFSGQFVNFYNEMVPDLQRLIPACEGKKDPIILIGAHSASGSAAIKALPNLTKKPDGFVGLDPFPIDVRKMKIDESIPTLEWGFAKTTCRTKIEQAAKPAYQISSKKHRIFYRVDNISQAVAHCVFTDKGCSIICGKKADGGWVPPAVAISIHNFIIAIKSGSFEKEQFELPHDDKANFELFVNQDDPDAESEL